jgi:ribosomal protein S27AE
MQNGVCPKCGSHVIIKNREVTDRADYSTPTPLSLTIIGRETGFLSNNIVTGQIRAWICGECGYTELFTTNFRKLLEADRESKTSNNK